MSTNFKISLNIVHIASVRANAFTLMLSGAPKYELNLYKVIRVYKL